VNAEDVEKLLGVKRHVRRATFTKRGFFAGRVHSPEEIIPQAVASRGAGPIARALDMLNNITGGCVSSASGQGGDIHIHVPTQVFSGMKISSDVDFARLLREANKRAVSDAVTEIKRQIGQGRT